MKICIQNGLIINPKTQLEEISDLWIEEGKVSFIGHKDEVADKIFDKFCDYLGYSLAATAAVIDPEIFIIGGGVSKAGQVLVDRVQAYFKKYAWPGIRGIEFALATLGNDAGICGAASIAIGE